MPPMFTMAEGSYGVWEVGARVESTQLHPGRAFECLLRTMSQSGYVRADPRESTIPSLPTTLASKSEKESA